MKEKSNIKNQISKTQTKNAKIFMFLVCVFYFLCFIFDFATAQPVSSTELINRAKELDGATVVYRGEVIGDIMQRGNFAWINVNDGQNAIGIWIDYALTKDIAYTGNYKFIGDTVEVNGIFHRACPEHGADLDIHAETLRKVESGKPVPEKLTRTKRNVTVLLIGVSGLLWISNQLRRK
jgi:hypothetical protein